MARKMVLLLAKARDDFNVFADAGPERIRDMSQTLKLPTMKPRGPVADNMDHTEASPGSLANA